MGGSSNRGLRRAARVGARGRVVIRGGGCGLGRIVDLSTTGVRVRPTGPRGSYRLGERVDLELRLDGASGGWWTLSGHIVRVDAEGGVAVEFDVVSTDFEDRVHSELLAARAAEDEQGVLLVDSIAARRGAAAVAFRAGGHHVREAATPLDAIDQLGESAYRPCFISIADTVPARIANDLRSYVRAEHRELVVVSTMEGPP